MSEEKPTSDGTYILVYFVLAVLTLAQVFVSFSGLGDKRIFVNMGIAIVQVSLLTMIFMHLKSADSVTKISAASAIFFNGLMFLYILTDYLTRQWLAY